MKAHYDELGVGRSSGEDPAQSILSLLPPDLSLSRALSDGLKSSGLQMDSDVLTRDFSCRHCPKTFLREEHARRHELTHSKDKPFRCGKCPKSFSRRDALQRHGSLHNGAPNLLQQGSRACHNCALAKARCSGTTPRCSRCTNRGIQCVYPRQSSVMTSLPLAPSLDGEVVVAQAQAAVSQDLYLHDEFFSADVLSATNWLDALADASPNFPFALGLHATPQPRNFLTQSDHFETPESSLPLKEITTTPCSIGSDRAETSSYVDGQSSRPPHVKRTKLISAARDLGQQEHYSGFALTWQPENDLDTSYPVEISPESHGQMIASFHRTCLVEWDSMPGFTSPCVPSKALLQQLLHMYWTSFNPALPFLHSSYNRAPTDIHLTLAMCAIGSHFTEATSQFIISMQEWVRRILLDVTEVSHNAISLSQARLLHHIASSFCGFNAHYGLSSGRESLRDIFHEAKSLFCVSRCSVSFSDLSWEIWLHQEQVKRLAFAAWLLDAIHCTHRQVHPLLSLADANLPLPCSDQIWEASNDADWRALISTKLPSPTLQESLQHLYIAKKLPRDRGEYARVLMIHGLYHRLWDVSRYYSNPLSLWDPTGERQESTVREPIWLPSVPAFCKWQNSTCDALDILHWQANATIGQHSGFEHPTVLHLHFARVVLLAPCEHIVTLAKYYIGTYNIPQASFDLAAQQVQRWAVQHQYKARLSAIHAGVMFWHIRHHSADAFYEASSIALATLTLWAFGTFARKQTHNMNVANPASASASASDSASAPAPAPAPPPLQLPPSEDDHLCEIILLDRPTDDELVQQFIRRGHKMQAHITGVGDLYAAHGPQRVLTQGHKILGTLDRWGVRTEWLELLGRLSAVLIGAGEHRGIGGGSGSAVGN